MTPTVHSAVTEDGITVALTRYAADVTRLAPVVLTHGTFSNGGLCGWLAAYLAQEGFDCWVLELGGHGASQRDGYRPDFEAFGLYDVPAAIDAVRQHTGRPQVFLVRHSAGGLAFLMHLARRPAAQREVAGVITLASQATGAYTTWRGWLAGHGVQVGTALLGYSAGRAWRLGPEDERKGVFDAWFRWNRTQDREGDRADHPTLGADAGGRDHPVATGPDTPGSPLSSSIGSVSIGAWRAGATGCKRSESNGLLCQVGADSGATGQT